MTTDITELAQREKFEAWWERAQHNGNPPRFGWEYWRDGEGYKVDDDESELDGMWSAWKAAGAELVEALEKAQEEAEELSKFKEVMTSAAEALKAGKPLNLESLFKGELASAMFAMMFAGEFVRSGATNYLELLYDVPEFGEMTVTLQKVEGKTPGQRIAELEESHAQVIQSRDHYKRMSEEGLKQLAESRTVTVKLPDLRQVVSGDRYVWSDGVFNYSQDVKAELTAKGIKWEAE